MIYKVLPLAVLTVGLLSPLSAASWDPLVEQKVGAIPELGQESTTTQGEPLYQEFDYPIQTAARLLGGTRRKGFTFQEGDVLGGWISNKGVKRFCAEKIQEIMGMKIRSLACLRQTAGGENFDSITWPGGRPYKLDEEVRFELLEVPVPREAAEAWVGNSYRYELIYQGAGGGVLRFLYREYVNDMAREAFSQELTYDLPDEGPFTVSAKGLRMEVLEAGNEGIRYTVLSGFSK